MADNEGKRFGENDRPPKSNFAGPIYLFLCESFTILGMKNEATENFNRWLIVAEDVQYTRIRDLSPDIKKDLESIEDDFVLTAADVENFSYAGLEEKLRIWAVRQATKKQTDEKAIKSLRISRASFYAWKKLGKDK